MDTTARALVEHWNWAANKGDMNKNTAFGLRSACSQVLSVLDDWETKDIRELDVEATLVRFQNLRKKDFKPAVLEAYKRRFRQAVASYMSYLDDPGGWKPRTARRAPSAETTSTSHQGAPTSRSRPQELPHANLVEYPFPLREGQIAHLTLPRDLKVAEVKRLTAFLSSLAIDVDPTVAG